VNLSRSLEHAQNVRGQKAAARLYNDIEQELALGEYTEDQADEAERALAVLEERFADVRAQSRNVTEPPRISHSAKRRLNDSAGDADADESRPAPAPTPAAARPRSSSPRPRRSSLAPNAGAALAAADVGGWGSLFGQFMLWGIGLSIAYLALTKSSAIAKLGLGATNIARAVVSPSLDPLNPKGAT
jgi:hypothetical protein